MNTQVYIIYNRHTDEIIICNTEKEARKYFKKNNEEFELNEEIETVFLEDESNYSKDTYLYCAPINTSSKKLFFLHYGEDGGGGSYHSSFWIYVFEDKEDALSEAKDIFDNEHEHDKTMEIDKDECKKDFITDLDKKGSANCLDYRTHEFSMSLIEVSVPGSGKFYPPFENIDSWYAFVKYGNDVAGFGPNKELSFSEAWEYTIDEAKEKHKDMKINLKWEDIPIFKYRTHKPKTDVALYLKPETDEPSGIVWVYRNPKMEFFVMKNVRGDKYQDTPWYRS